MGDPSHYLPSCGRHDITSELASIGFPSAQDISQLEVGAAYHKIFRLTFSRSDYDDILTRADLHRDYGENSVVNDRATDTCLILRVSGSHVPTIKIANEVGVLTYLARHTSIPVPQIVHYDQTTSNNLKNEYMIMTLLPGLNGSDVFPTLTQAQLSHILDQLVSICIDLYDLNFSHIGGLKPDIDTQTTKFPQKLLDLPLVRGPPILETMWQSPDIDRYFNSDSSLPRSSFDTLNAVSSDGYDTYSSWLSAQIDVYIHAVSIHPALSWVQELDPDLTALRTFTSSLSTDLALQTKLNNVPLKLAHRDMHFGNLLLSPEPPNLQTTSPTPASETRYKITGILDWEFAAIVPFPLWRHSFLWDGIRTPPLTYPHSHAQFMADERKQRNRLYDIWAERVRQRVKHQHPHLDGDVDHDANNEVVRVGDSMLHDAEWKNPEQEAAWDVVNYLRCIVEVCPRNKQLEDARRWWKEVVRALKVFGIGAGKDGNLRNRKGDEE